MNNLVQCLTTLTVRFFFSLCSIGTSFVASCAFCPSHSVFPSTSQTPGHIFSIILLQAVENSSKDLSLLDFSKQRSHIRPTSNVTGCSTLITSAAALRWTLSSLWAPLLFLRAQNWRLCSGCSFRGAEWRGITVSLDRLGYTLLLRQPGVWLVLTTARVHCWLTLNLPTPRKAAATFRGFSSCL